MESIGVDSWIVKITTVLKTIKLEVDEGGDAPNLKGEQNGSQLFLEIMFMNQGF
jgi:hypothetical protein